MAHEELKKQYEEDCKNHNHPWSLWEFFYESGGHWKQCIYPSPDWHPDTKYRRKESPFTPEYFSGLNWRDAKKLVGKVVECSDNAEDWIVGKLTSLDCNKKNRFRVDKEDCWAFIKTCPVTYVHPTITIAGGWKLPMPEVKTPRHGATVWIVTPFHPDGYTESVWQGFGGEQIALKKGYVHLTDDRAQEWADWWRDTVVAAVNK
jgi:hypothetical protein